MTGIIMERTRILMGMTGILMGMTEILMEMTGGILMDMTGIPMNKKEDPSMMTISKANIWGTIEISRIITTKEDSFTMTSFRGGLDTTVKMKEETGPHDTIAIM
jgi:hypothetical protein